MAICFLSFRDVENNTNLGCCWLEIENQKDIIEATDKARALGINPGGEVLMRTVREIDDGMELNKLYSSEELYKKGYKKFKGKIPQCSCCKGEEAANNKNIADQVNSILNKR